MGACASRPRRSHELLGEIAALQAILSQQKVEAEAAIQTLVMRVDHLERFSEELIKLAEELKASEGTHMNRSKSREEQVVYDFVVHPSAESSLLFATDAKVHACWEKCKCT